MNKMVERKKVVVGIIIDNDKVFLLRHNKCKGLLIFPSGKVEEGESVKEALIREMKEELNIDVLEYEEFAYNFPQWYDRVDGIMHTQEDVFIITRYSGELINNEPTKHLELIKTYIDDIISNPKDYTYSTYHYALMIREQQEEKWSK